MKFVEIAPERYDWAVSFITGGRIDRIKDRIADQVRAGDRVVDIGCGTGTLGLRCLEKGAYVTGLDASEFMLEQFRKSAAERGLTERLKLIQASVTQLEKHFADESVDVITSTMVLGEFPREYLDFIFRHCHRILRPGGRLLTADEVWPDTPGRRMIARATMAAFWIPQFLLLRRVTYPISDLEGLIALAGFHIERVDRWPGSSFRLVYGVRPPQFPEAEDTAPMREVTIR